MFDVFYLDHPTGKFPHERQADSIEHARELSRTRYLWIVNGHNDYSGFDWLWEPAPWESQQAHVWPSQHQENGGTWLVPKSGYTDVNRFHTVVPRRATVARLAIDHGSGQHIPAEYHARYINNYLGTLRRALSHINDEYVWIVSNVCRYEFFDFSWHPSEWQTDMLHVFASDDQKFGDTFYIHRESFLAKTERLSLLEWFDTIHFVEDVKVPRQAWPVVEHKQSSHVDSVWNYDFRDPYAQFSRYTPSSTVPAVNLWRPETRAIIPLLNGAGNVLVPRDVKSHLKTQLYDYPVIDRNHYRSSTDPNLDIVFISNGEPNAEQNYYLLQQRAEKFNSRIHRVDGVKGRVLAYQTAASCSSTDWFFAVFAKLEVSINFDWSWQPDRMQQAKHYIFHAENPVNGLVYGHQAMIAYNREMTLANPGLGLDFTLDDPHEVVPIVSGIARYNVSPWMTWRTAFREVLKLKQQLPNIDAEYRIDRWAKDQIDSMGFHHQCWSQQGALDALEYYDQVQGDFQELKKSYEWDWLATYAFIKHGLTQ